MPGVPLLDGDGSVGRRRRSDPGQEGTSGSSLTSPLLLHPPL